MRLVLGLAIASVSLCGQVLPSPERWMEHLRADLIRFWDHADALGSPVGSFPTMRCDDGKRLDRDNPCPEVRANSWLMLDRQYAVALSRQAYGYGVAYHMTGDPKYLHYAKAGVDYIRSHVLDRVRGGAFAYYDGTSKQWEPRAVHRNPQELAYALLGIGFYYYLTRDAEVLPDLLAAKRFIMENYANPELNALQWMLEDAPPVRAREKRIVATLDQMNAYMVLLAPILPEPDSTEWKADLKRLARMLIEEFYSPEHNLFFLNTTTEQGKDLRFATVDFGHTIKSFWMIRWTGILTGDEEMVRFAEENGRRVLDWAFLGPEDGWANAVTPAGISRDTDWWVFAELDQFAATLSIADGEMARKLEHTFEYWFRNFVDPASGEVWSTVNATTHLPLRNNPKQWPWKNAYHSTEHALVGYVTSSARQERVLPLYFAWADQPETVRPYFFDGEVESVISWEEAGVPVRQVNFVGVR